MLFALYGPAGVAGPKDPSTRRWTGSVGRVVLDLGRCATTGGARPWAPRPSEISGADGLVFTAGARLCNELDLDILFGRIVRGRPRDDAADYGVSVLNLTGPFIEPVWV
jgi:hypothetical protein